MKKELVIIMCPPLSKYPVPPEDQPGCLQEKCEDCEQLMWISSKKRMIRANTSKDTLTSCYDCLTERVVDNPRIFKDHIVVNI